MTSNPSAAAALELNYFPQSANTPTHRPRSHISMNRATRASMRPVSKSGSREVSPIYAAPFPVKTTAIVWRMILRSMATDRRAM